MPVLSSVYKERICPSVLQAQGVALYLLSYSSSWICKYLLELHWEALRLKERDGSPAHLSKCLPSSSAKKNLIVSDHPTRINHTVITAWKLYTYFLKLITSGIAYSVSLLLWKGLLDTFVLFIPNIKLALSKTLCMYPRKRTVFFFFFYFSLWFPGSSGLYLVHNYSNIFNFPLLLIGLSSSF